MSFEEESNNENDVPERNFLHVEKSLDNGISEGMLLEIPHRENPDVYWIAKITMVCGHLLRVCYIGSSTDFWCDISKTNIRPLGWCGRYENLIEPPEEIVDRHGHNNILKLIKTNVTNAVTLSDESLKGKGLTPIDRIQVSMKLEVQCDKEPYKYWIASIVRNVSGRLLLRYDGPVCANNEFWIFYTSPRLRPLGYTKSKGHPWKLEHPDSHNESFNFSGWQACIENAHRVAKDNPFPPDLMWESKSQFHSFEVGMKVEALDPSNMSKICPATVVKVFDSYFFLIVIDNYLNDCNNDGGHWLCSLSHPFIFPSGWAQSQGVEISAPISWDRRKPFDWSEYLQMTTSIAAPPKYFRKACAPPEINFEAGMKLEAVDPMSPLNISSAQILDTKQHLLLIELQSTGCSYWYSNTSQDLFPSGWCASNNVALHQNVPTDKDTTSNDNLLDAKECQNLAMPLQSAQEWCDRIYFNYKCYAGPFLSRNKLSQLPKYVGPGPLSLVIKEVLNMIISVAYKPAKLLKDWEWEGKIQPDTKLEVLKAKLKTSTYRASVEVVGQKCEIPVFCKDMCSKLQACPYLFGPIELIKEQCPERCLLVDKATFQMAVASEKRGRPKGSCSKSAVPKCWNTNKKRRKKGLHFMTIRARERRAALEAAGILNKDGDESANESDSPSSTPQQSEAGTRPNSPDSNSDPVNKKQRKKREPRTNFPPLEMKTRGAKLPNFALQIKEGHWDKKDVETIYSNSLALPKKQYLDDSETEESYSSDYIEIDEFISNVSDSEEPELKKLRLSPLNNDLPTDSNLFQIGNPTISAFINVLSKKLQLPFDPCKWSIADLYNYLMNYDECKVVAHKLREEQVDGLAFIMLNLPTLREHLKMKTKPAIDLCKHVMILKWAHLSQITIETA